MKRAVSPYSRRRLSTTAREALYDRCRGAAEFPTCNICGQLILVGDAWDESHDPDGPPPLLRRGGNRRRSSDLQPAARRRGCQAFGRQGHPQPSKAHRGVPDPPQAARWADGLEEEEARRQRGRKTLNSAPSHFPALSIAALPRHGLHQGFNHHDHCQTISPDSRRGR
jgi:hypothetical protein